MKMKLKVVVLPQDGSWGAVREKMKAMLEGGIRS